MVQGCVDMHWAEEIYWSFIGSVPFLGAVGIGGRAYRDPDTFTTEEVGTSLVSSALIGFATGKLVPNLAEFKQFKTLKTLQLAGRGLIVSPVILVPTALAVTSAIGYEKSVNEPIRDLPGHSNSVWRGAFASGFGPVV